MATTELPASAPTVDRSRGRGLFWLGIAIAVLAVAAMFVQISLRILIVPWYVPIAMTFAAACLLMSLAQRRSVTRIVALLLVAGLAGAEWYFVAHLSKLPEYAGPARAGQPIPAFTTTLADGRSVGDRDLANGTPSVLTFFRGRW
jgi:hypothetical protein